MIEIQEVAEYAAVSEGVVMRWARQSLISLPRGGTGCRRHWRRSKIIPQIDAVRAQFAASLIEVGENPVCMTELVKLTGLSLAKAGAWASLLPTKVKAIDGRCLFRRSEVDAKLDADRKRREVILADPVNQEEVAASLRISVTGVTAFISKLKNIPRPIQHDGVDLWGRVEITALLDKRPQCSKCGERTMANIGAIDGKRICYPCKGD